MAYVSSVTLLQEVSVTHSVCMVLHCLSACYLQLAQITGINGLSALALRRSVWGQSAARPWAQFRWLEGQPYYSLKKRPNFFSRDLRVL